MEQINGEGPALDIRFEMQEHPQILEFVCIGTYEPDLPVRIAEHALKQAAPAGKTAVLVDIRQISGRAPTMSERYEQAVQIADLQARQMPRIRMAVLGLEPMIHPQRFGEVVATNRGAHLRVFTERAEALSWLQSAPKPA